MECWNSHSGYLFIYCMSIQNRDLYFEQNNLNFFPQLCISRSYDLHNKMFIIFLLKNIFTLFQNATESTLK